MTLLAQVHAPLLVFDRVLYVFTCETCGKNNIPNATAYRSQIYNPEYESVETKPAAKTSVFEETDDWGDDEPAQATSKPPEVTPSDACSHNFASVPVTLPTDAEKVDRDGPFYAGQLLDIFEDDAPTTLFDDDGDATTNPRKGTQATGAEIDPEVFDETSIEHDDDDVKEKCAAHFLASIARCQSQCVRWQPGGLPLLSSPILPMINPPPCERCNAPRRFEFQVVPPIVYVLTHGSSQRVGDDSTNARRGANAARGGLPDESHGLRFGNILVFTCSNAECGCYAPTTPAYCAEWCVVEPEL